MVFVCHVLLKKANIHISFIYFNRNFDHPHITVVTFVTIQKIRDFFHKNIVSIEKVFDMYLLLVCPHFLVKIARLLLLLYF